MCGGCSCGHATPASSSTSARTGPGDWPDPGGARLPRPPGCPRRPVPRRHARPGAALARVRLLPLRHLRAAREAPPRRRRHQRTRAQDGLPLPRARRPLRHPRGRVGPGPDGRPARPRRTRGTPPGRRRARREADPRANRRPAGPQGEAAGLFSQRAIDGAQLARITADADRETAALRLRLAAAVKASPLSGMPAGAEAIRGWLAGHHVSRQRVIAGELLEWVRVMPAEGGESLRGRARGTVF